MQIPRCASRNSSNVKTVAVFCYTPGPNAVQEVADTVQAIRAARSQGIAVRLVAVGRSTAEMRAEIESGLAGSGAEISILGMLPAEEISRSSLGGRRATFRLRPRIATPEHGAGRYCLRPADRRLSGPRGRHADCPSRPVPCPVPRFQRSERRAYQSLAAR